MAIDKGVYQAPQGIAEVEGPTIEIEIIEDSGDIGETSDGLDHEDTGSDEFNKTSLKTWMMGYYSLLLVN